MAGQMTEFGVITQSTMAFATLVGAFSLIITQFQSISAFTAVVARLHTLNEAIDKAQEITPCMMSVEGKPDKVVFAAVTLHSADKSRLLIANLNLEITRGSRWVVVGKEDAPKVALFRATAGVWECGGGTITRPSLDDILFLPERPYFPPGTLRDALLRIGSESATTDEQIMAALTRLGIESVVAHAHAHGLDRDHDWDDLLSIGEQHLLSFTRIYLAKPTFVVLDRPGSALGEKEISIILEMLAEQGTGVLVLAKNGEAHLRYDGVLQLKLGGAWEVTSTAFVESISESYDLTC